MEQIISNELLSEVISKRLKRHNPSFKNITESAYDKHFNALIINYTDNNGITLGYMINIYELAHKCKEWAWDKGYSFEIIPFCVSIFNLETQKEEAFRYDLQDMKGKVPFLNKYIFKACEHIRKELLK